MKACKTCGTPHPDDVTTSHHPDNCTCGISLCGGTGPNGCIWSRTFRIPPGGNRMDAQIEYWRLIAEREAAIREAVK